MLVKREPVPLLLSGHVSPAVSTNYALYDTSFSLAGGSLYLFSLLIFIYLGELPPFF